MARTRESEILLDVNGVGYRVAVTTSMLATTVEGSDLNLHVHTHVREDALVLYGFASAEERACFEALLGAHGVGPTLALSIMSALGPTEITRAVMSEDLASLCSVPGIGRKTAARLVLDLKSRLSVPDLGDTGVVGSDLHTEARGDVRAALAELGYANEEIVRALASLPADGSVEDMLRSALRQLATVA